MFPPSALSAISKMCSKKLLLVCVSIVLVSSEVGKRREESRKSRFITFDTVDDDVRVNLEFSIPFLSIPSKKAVNSVYGLFSSGLPTININPASLALGGAVVLGTTVLIPLLAKSYAFHNPQERYSRLLDSTEFSTDAVLDFASQMLSDNRAVRGCALRIACWAAQRTTKTDPMRIWKQFTRNSLVAAMVNSTAIEDAMLSGSKGRDCTSYVPCALREEHIPMLLGNFVGFS